MPSHPIITTIGEALVDFVATSTGTLFRAPGFCKALGGEGANVAVGIARLGTHSVFIGKVGADSFGEFLVSRLRENGVDAKRVVFDYKHKTRLAFVSLQESGERDFEFWEKSPAGEQLHRREIAVNALTKSRIVNIAPLLLLNNPSRSTAFVLADTLTKRSVAVAFDANLRPSLWKSGTQMKSVVKQMINRSTILRLNKEEAMTIAGRDTIDAAAERLLFMGPTLLLVTDGANGSYFRTKNVSGFSPAYKVKAIDTTGCGDAFFAAALHIIAHIGRDLESLTEDELSGLCSFANAAGALTAMGVGGADAMPDAARIIQLMKDQVHA